MLVSDIQQSDSVTHIHISILFQLLSHLGYYRILRPVVNFLKIHGMFWITVLDQLSFANVFSQSVAWLLILFSVSFRKCMSVCMHANSLQSLPDSWQPYGPQLSRLLCPWDFLGNTTRVACHAFLQGIFPTLGSNLHLLCLLH